MTITHTMVQYATLWAIADYVEQRYISKKPKQDWHKSFRMVTVGAFVIGPLVYGWVRVAERLSPGNQLRNVLKKVLIGQTVFAPFAISTFYASTSLLEGKSVNQFKTEWNEKFPTTYFNNLKVWPAVQIVNFSYVPLIHRPKVMGCVSFIWSMYLCFQKEDTHSEDVETTKAELHVSSTDILTDVNINTDPCTDVKIRNVSNKQGPQPTEKDQR